MPDLAPAQRVERSGYSLSVTHYPPGLRMPTHAHPSTGISLVLRGSLEEEVLTQRVVACAGSSVVKPAGTAHENRFGPAGAVLLNITFTEESRWLGEDAGLDFPTWAWFRSLEPYRIALQVLQCLGSCPGALDDRVTEFAASVGAAAETEGSARLPRWAGEVRACLEERASDALSVADLARSLDLHPVYLARQFRAYFGCSLSAYRRRARVLAAARLVSSHGMSLSRVAQEAGFSDHSHLCRELRRELCCSPSALRELLSTA